MNSRISIYAYSVEKLINNTLSNENEYIIKQGIVIGEDNRVLEAGKEYSETEKYINALSKVNAAVFCNGGQKRGEGIKLEKIDITQNDYDISNLSDDNFFLLLGAIKEGKEEIIELE